MADFNVYSIITKALSSLSVDKSQKKATNDALSVALKQAERANQMPDYDAMLPTQLDVEAKTFNPKSDDALKMEAKSVVEKSMEDKLKKVEDTYQKKLTSATLKEENKKQNILDKTNKLTEKYVKDTESATFKAIKNGLANSSIITNYLDSIDQNFVKQIENLNAEYATFSQNIQKEIDIASANKQEALASYEIKAALEIEKKLIELKKEQASIIEAVNNYNKQLLIDKETFAYDRAKTLEALKKAWELQNK